MLLTGTSALCAIAAASIAGPGAAQSPPLPSPPSPAPAAGVDELAAAAARVAARRPRSDLLLTVVPLAAPDGRAHRPGRQGR